MEQALIWKLWGPLLTMVLIFAVRLNRARRERPFRPDRLWVAPALFGALVLGLVILQPPPLTGYAALALGFVGGLPLGLRRGRLITIRRDAASGSYIQRGRRTAIVILMSLVIARFALHFLFGGQSASAASHQAAVVLGDLLLGAAFGIVTGTRIDLRRRARRLARAS